jgi:hypothetical protein
LDFVSPFGLHRLWVMGYMGLYFSCVAKMSFRVRVRIRVRVRVRVRIKVRVGSRLALA